MTDRIRDTEKSEGDSLNPPTRPPVGFSFALPAGWHHLRLNEHRNAAVERLIDELLRGYSRDQVFQLRQQLASETRALLDEAFGRGSTDVYLLADLRYGLPLAATCLATPSDREFPIDVPGEALALLLADDGDRVGSLTVEGANCAAILRVSALPVDVNEAPAIGDDGAEPKPEPRMEDASVTRLDVYVPWPGQPRVLVLSFSTPIIELAYEMTVLFEAIAESLRWRWE